MALSDHDDARVFLQQALYLATASGNTRAVIATEFNLGDAYRYAGSSTRPGADLRRARRPVCQRLHLDSGRSRPGSRLGYRVPLRGAITDVTPPTGGSRRMSSKRSKNPALPVLDDAFRLASVKDAEESTRDLAARLATTELRRVSHPGRVTWEPTDQAEPVPVPPTVVDGDGDLWLRDRGTGTWTMPEFNPKEFPARCGEVLTWNQLACEFGPLTALADDRRIGGGRR